MSLFILNDSNPREKWNSINEKLHDQINSVNSSAVNSGGSSFGQDLKNAFIGNSAEQRGILASLANMLTGDSDYMRDIAKINLQNEFNASEAQKQRDYEERMSNTAIQRQMADLANAGLNPYAAIAASGNISSASTPSASAASSGSSSATSSGKTFIALLGAFLTSVSKFIK